MGADGGTIPKRCELVRKKKKVEKLEKAVKNAVKWRTCQLSQQPLKKPIIACRFGRLYNKEAIIEAILNKTIANTEITAHIKGTKDFKQLRLAENKDYSEDGVKGDAYLDHNQTPFLCPVTSLPMNGNQPFVVNWKCGCVYSEKAMQEVRSDACHGCAGPVDPKDIVVLYPGDELLEQYKEKLAAERKTKKEKKATTIEELNGKNGESKTQTANVENGKSKTASAADAAKQVKKAEKRKAGDSSIQDDPTKSDAYKKLFTTCEAAKNKPEGHWVTYNPLFY